MRRVTLDFETYWTPDYSLKKINFIEYITDPRFEVISVSIKEGDNPTRCYFGSTVEGALKAVDWSDVVAVAHNGIGFDFPILVWKYGCHPFMFADTLCMARPLHQSTVGGSLAALSLHYNLPAKNGNVLSETCGVRYADFTLDQLARMAAYNKGDVDNTSELYKIFVKNTPPKEMMLIDMTAQMTVYPELVVDTDLLATSEELVRNSKKEALRGIMPVIGAVDEEDAARILQSNGKFAAALRSLNIDPPVKVSETTGKTTWAFSKTDEEFLALLDSDDEKVQALVAARLGTKSTILETRMRTMQQLANARDQRIPVTLNYHGATTGRWSGSIWNPQNLPRIARAKDGAPTSKPSNALRMALRAPEGYKVVVADLSGIELRVNHFLWDVRSTKQMYAADPKADLYRAFAAQLYKKEEEDVTKEERQLAKVAQLGLGFGAGAPTFRKVARLMGGINLSEEGAERVVGIWRETYSEIVDGWRRCKIAVSAMCSGGRVSVDPRSFVVVDSDEIVLPSGRSLYYPRIHFEHETDTKTGNNTQVAYYGMGSKQSKVYAGLLDENIVQAIARDVLADQALMIQKLWGYTPALTVHDELVYVIAADEAEWALSKIQQIMRRTPSWIPGLVLWSEGDVADSYGEAK